MDNKNVNRLLTGCGCMTVLSLGVGTYFTCRVIKWTAGKVDDIIQQVPGTYITVICAGIIIGEILTGPKGKDTSGKQSHNGLSFGTLSKKAFHKTRDLLKLLTYTSHQRKEASKKQSEPQSPSGPRTIEIQVEVVKE